MNLRSVLLPALCAALCAGTAQADRFHLGSAETAERMTEGEPDVIEGVLLREEGDRYVIRVEGGEIQIPKSRVRKIEKDGLTVADLQNREQEAREALAQADAARAQQQREARARLEEQRREVRAMEASARRSDDRGEVREASAPRQPQLIYDPVLDVLRPAQASGDNFVINRLTQSLYGGEIRRAMQRQQRNRR